MRGPSAGQAMQRHCDLLQQRHCGTYPPEIPKGADTLLRADDRAWAIVLAGMLDSSTTVTCRRPAALRRAKPRIDLRGRANLRLASTSEVLRFERLDTPGPVSARRLRPGVAVCGDLREVLLAHHQAPRHPHPAGLSRLAPALAVSPPQRRPHPQASAQVDRQVWNDLASAADHRARFVVSMRETTGGGPASAIPAQMALEEPLAILQRVGTVASFTAYYGANAIVGRGRPRRSPLPGGVARGRGDPSVPRRQPLGSCARCAEAPGRNRAHHRSGDRPRRDHAPGRHPR